MARWGFRVASSPSVGSGHLARCLAIAQALDEPVSLFLDPDATNDGGAGGVARDIIREHGLAACDALLLAVTMHKVDAVLIDSYHVPADVTQALHRQVFVAACCDFQPYPDVDLVVAPLAQHTAGAQILSGAQYAPLASGFVEAHAEAQSRPWRLYENPRLLVAFGTIDNPNLTGMALTALAQLDRPTELVVALGADAPHLDKVRRQLESFPGARLIVGGSNMVALYEDVDLAIGAPGISMLERACCGVPSIVVCQNQRQAASAEAARAWGFARAVDATAPGIVDAVRNCILDPEATHRLRERGLALVDGRGASRVAERLSRGAKARA